MKKLVHFFKLVWKIDARYVMLLVLQSVCAGAGVFCNIIFPRYLIEELMGNKSPQMLFLWGALIVGANVFWKLCDNTLKKHIQVKDMGIYHRLNEAMAEKIMRLEYSYLENPSYLDLKERAVFAVTNQSATIVLIRQASQTFTEILTLVGLLAIMATLGPVLLIALAAAVAGMLGMNKWMSNEQVRITQDIIPINRKFGYYMGLSNESEVQKDVRLYDMTDMLSDRLVDYTRETCDLFQVMGRKMGVSLGGMNFINDAVAAFCYLYVGLRTLGAKVFGMYLGSQISIGALTMYVSSAIRFSTSMRAVGENVVGVLQMLAFLDPYMEFMELPEEENLSGGDRLTEGIETIEFRHVTFTYPGSEKPVLTDVSFAVEKGEKISVVGLNGAGKSTLVKLLCRMYKVDGGEILINGRSIYEYDYESYMQTVSAVFQDYRLFHFTISENISCKDSRADEEKVMQLVREVGLKEKIDSLKDGILSRFGREYDEQGIKLSGGESQKVAIARALYKNGSLVILDEPASALDPIAEAEIYEKFNGLVEDKTAFYISHRMSSSVFCDRILVIDGGRVADFDTHENLMKKTDSLYYKLFCSQAENYQLENAG